MPEMEKTGPDLIIIRRRQSRTADVPKGGVWKIAHADFMTAMMALFLVLWLVNSTTRETRTTVAQYFNPIRLSDVTQDRKGVRDPQEADPGEVDDASRQDNKTAGTAAKEAQRAPTAKLKERAQASAPFEDPYAILAEASAVRPNPGAEKASAITLGETGKPGMQGGEALRDPFDPNFWRQAPQGERQSQPDSAAKPADTAGKPVMPPSPPVLALAAAKPPGTAENAAAQAQAQAAERSGEAQNASPRPAGTQPLTPRPETAPEKVALPSPTLAQKQADDAVAAAIATAIGSSGKGDGKRSDAPQVEVRQTDEGMLISLTDNANFGMFAIGSAEPATETVSVMQRVAAVLNKREGSIIIRGHTDARPFRSGNGDNWRLSTARAHTAQDLLVRGGVDEARIEHVEGYASRKLRAADPGAAENRRIEILVREKRT
ncbi:MotB family protein [Bosea caraganae]|nr:MotB family protein [Bosea caraganae]